MNNSAMEYLISGMLFLLYTAFLIYVYNIKFYRDSLFGLKYRPLFCNLKAEKVIESFLLTFGDHGVNRGQY